MQLVAQAGLEKLRVLKGSFDSYYGHVDGVSLSRP